MRAESVSEMSPHIIEIQIDEQFQTQVRPEPLRQAVVATLAHQQVREPCELAVVVTDDGTLRELNYRHRGVDAPTDVLAFPDEVRGPFVRVPGLPRYLGDVILSFCRAETQAAEAGHTVQVELQLLTVHGVLHLLGYDDVREEQRAQMWDVQAEVLQDLGIHVRI